MTLSLSTESPSTLKHLVTTLPSSLWMHLLAVAKLPLPNKSSLSQLVFKLDASYDRKDGVILALYFVSLKT